MKYAPDIFVGVDQSMTASGWCIVTGGRTQSHGVAKEADDIVAAVETLRVLCGGAWGRVLVALEDHGTHSYNANAKFKRNPDTLLGMGEARGYWVHELARDHKHPRMLRIFIDTGDWRMRVLGMSNRAGTERCKAEALRWAATRAVYPLADDNEAEAVCIAHWASLDGAALLERGRLRRRVSARAQRQRSKQLDIEVRG